MTINSMTGFASAETGVAAGNLAWELRSVNHRYLEIQLKLPEGFRGVEAAVRDQISGRLLRGKIDAALQFRPSADRVASIAINDQLAAEVIARARELEDKIHTPAPLSAMDVLSWPGVVKEDELDASALFEPAQAALAQALQDLVATRGREGERIHAVLEEKLVQVGELVADVRKRMPEVLENLRLRLQERASTFEVKIDNERLEQEIVMLAQKLDVAEELDRLDAHVEEVRSTFKTQGAIGRKLDFLMQELNREANTLGSKSADPETSRASVELKVLIEQMREQVQNIE
jgi:uncharacterized protein (TIGR00255 family)